MHRADEWLYAAKAGGRNQVQPALPAERLEALNEARLQPLMNARMESGREPAVTAP